MLKPYIKQLELGLDLTFEQSYKALNIILQNDIPVQTAAFLVLLSSKGETPNEFAGLIKSVKEHATTIKLDYPVVDIVGTGGDNSGSVNISTAAALLTAACLVPVVKHGNRAQSSICGSADVLEQLGYKLNQSSDDIVESVKETNFGFCFAPNFHPVLAMVRDIRKSLGVPTIFNLLGPMCNPANAEHIVLGVYDPKRVDLIANTLLKIGTKRSIVFSANGMDELSCIGPIEALVVSDKIEKIMIAPEELGLRKCSLADLAGGDALYNSGLISKAFSGVDTSITDTLILNAAVALYIYGTNASLKECVNIVKERIKQGNIIPRNRLHEIILRKSKVPVKKKSLKSALMSKPSGTVLAEIKRASPSAGSIASISDPVARAISYVEAGASAISVLTDEGFSGLIDDLKNVAKALKDTNIPILCKDFFIYPEQIADAKNAGADAILIMVSVLHNNTARMVRLAHEFGLEALVEVHSPDELPIALHSGADVIGVNQRDLRDFSMHPEIYGDLIKLIPHNIVKIAESGVNSYEDALNMYRLGYNAVLVGTALSKLNDPREFFGNWQ